MKQEQSATKLKQSRQPAAAAECKMETHCSHAVLALPQQFFLVSLPFPDAIYQGHLLTSRHPVPAFPGLCRPPHTQLSPCSGTCCFKEFKHFLMILAKRGEDLVDNLWEEQSWGQEDAACTGVFPEGPPQSYPDMTGYDQDISQI